MNLTNDSTVEVTENKNVITKINNKIYNLFVDKSQLKTDLVIPLSNINSQISVPNLQGNDLAGENYKISFTEKSTYAKFLERLLSFLIKVQGVKTVQGNVGFQQTINAANEPSIYQLTNGVQANFYNSPLLRFCCDPLNSMIRSTTIKMGKTGTSIDNPLTPTLVNIIRKMSNPDIVNNYYQGLLSPETFNHNYKVNCSSDNIMMGAKISPEGGQLPSNTGQFTFISGTCDIDDLNTTLGYDRRNIFTNAEYKFSKAKESQNYKWDTTTLNQHKFIPDGAPTKQLYTMKIGEYFYPTNVSNWNDFLNDKLNLGYAALLYYTDKRSLIGTLVPENTTVNPSIPAYYRYETEPADQSMFIEIAFNNIRSPLLHPLLDDVPTNSFTNCKDMEVSITLHNDLYNKICYNIYNPRPGESLGTASISIVPKSQSLTYHQIDIGMLYTAIKPTITLPYYVYYNREQSRTMEQRQLPMSVGTGTYTGYNRIEFSETINISDKIPKYLLIYISSQKSVPYKITSLQIMLNNRSDIMLQSIDQLIDASRDNGLRLKPQDQFNDWHVLTSYNHSKKIQGQTGTPLLLLFGTNIPLPIDGAAATAPLMSNTNMSISYKVGVEFDFPYSDMQIEPDFAGDTVKNNIIELNITHITEGILSLSDNVGTKVIEDISTNDFISGIKSINNASSQNDFSLNKNEIISGGTNKFHSRPVAVSARRAGASTVGGSDDVGSSNAIGSSRKVMKDFLLR